MVASSSSAAGASTPPSTKKRVIAQNGITINIHVPAKTGNKQQDDAAAHELLCLQNAINDLIDIKPLRARAFAFIHREKAALAKLDGVSQDAVTFSDATTISSIDDEFKIAFITSHSDLSSEDIVAVCKADASGLDLLCQAALQLPFRQSLPAQFQVKEVTKAFWRDRQQECGSRLRGFKEKGGLVGTPPTLNFKGSTGAYILAFGGAGGKVLKQITHFTGHTVEVQEKLNITTSYTSFGNHDDQAASLIMTPLPPIKLSSFFDRRARRGPWSITVFHGQPKEMARRAEEYYESWDVERRRTSGTAERSIRNAIEEHKHSMQKDQMLRARAKAQTAFQNKRQRRAISLETVEG